MNNRKSICRPVLAILAGFFCMHVVAEEKTTSLLQEDDKIAQIQDGKIRLATGDFEMTFDGTKAFHLASINYGDKKWVKDGGMNGAIWRIKLLGPNGVNPELMPEHGQYQGAEILLNNADTAAVCFTWKMKSGIREFYPIRMYVGLGRKTGLTEWKMEADLPKGWRVAETDFPRLLLDRKDSDTAILPTGWGTEQTIYQAANFECVYPSHSAGMQLLMMRDQDDVVYFATHDKSASIKTLRLRGLWGAALLSNEAVASAAWTPEEGGTFKMPWSVSVGFTDKGWEYCATHWYRPFTYQTEWGSKTFQDRKTPQWLLDNDMWLRPHFAADSTWNSLEQAMKFFGPDCGIHWYRWHQIAYDSEYPQYFPAKEAIPEMFAKARKMGGHVIPYINGRLWDPASKSYTEWNGKEASCRKADGTLYTEIYPTSMVPNTITCPSSPIWQNIVTGLVKRIQEELNTDGVYIDQIGAAAGAPCYADNHPHPNGGGEFWVASYRKMLDGIRQTLKPGNIIITEDNSECYMDKFDIMLMVNTPQAKSIKLVPLYPLIYSDRMMVDCFLYYPLTEPVHDMRFRWKNMMGLLWGTQLGWVKPELLMAPEALPESEFLRTLARFRHKQHDVLYGGQFLKEVIPGGDNPVISFPTLPDSPVVMGAEWLSPEGRKVMYLVNMDDQNHKVIVNGKEYKVKATNALRVNLD